MRFRVTVTASGARCSALRLDAVHGALLLPVSIAVERVRSLNPYCVFTAIDQAH
jgi:hypothetical protein